MNTRLITEIIDWAMRQGVYPFMPAPYMYPGSFGAKMMINNMVRVEEATLEAVVKVLKNEPQLQVFDGGVIRISPGMGRSIDLTDLSRWLLAQSSLYGSRAAAKRLQEFVEGLHRGVLEVLALVGVTIEKEIELSHGVSLIPFSSLPESQMTQYLSHDPLQDFRDPLRRMFIPAPTAALVSTEKDGIELIEKFPNPEEDSAYTSKQKLLWQISQYLTLLGPSSPTPVGQWSQLVSPERVPILGMVHSWGNSLQEAYPLTTTALPKEADVQSLVELYLTLDKDLKKKLAIPIQRLNMTLRRQDTVDKAIELGIALEALLVADRDSDAQVSYLLRVRGAWLGGGSLEKRKENHKLLKQVYGLRSRAVHSGTLNRQQADKILHKGSVLCATLIRRVIEQGSMPDWDDLILTPDLGSPIK